MISELLNKLFTLEDNRSINVLPTNNKEDETMPQVIEATPINQASTASHKLAEVLAELESTKAKLSKAKDKAKKDKEKIQALAEDNAKHRESLDNFLTGRVLNSGIDEAVKEVLTMIRYDIKRAELSGATTIDLVSVKMIGQLLTGNAAHDDEALLMIEAD